MDLDEVIERGIDFEQPDGVAESAPNTNETSVLSDFHNACRNMA